MSPSFVSRQRRRYNIPTLTPAREAILDGRLQMVSTRGRKPRPRRPDAPQGRPRALTAKMYLEVRDRLAAAGCKTNDCAVRRALAADGVKVSRTTVRQRRTEIEAALRAGPPAPPCPTVTDVFEKAGATSSITRADVRAQMLSDRKATWWLRLKLRADELVPIGRTRSRRYLDASTVRLLDVELDVVDALLDFYHRPCPSTFEEAEAAIGAWPERVDRGGLTGLAERAEAASIDLVSEAVAYFGEWSRR